MCISSAFIHIYYIRQGTKPSRTRVSLIENFHAAAGASRSIFDSNFNGQCQINSWWETCPPSKSLAVLMWPQSLGQYLIESPVKELGMAPLVATSC